MLILLYEMAFREGDLYQDIMLYVADGLCDVDNKKARPEFEQWTGSLMLTFKYRVRI
jgi:hypothetical protein